MNPGDIITAGISSINSEGEGVARFGSDGFVMFVPGALPGESAVCRVVRTSRNYAAARVVEIKAASPERVEPRCPSYDRCGGCQLQHAKYEAQIEIKGKILTDAMTRIGKITLPSSVICAPSPERWAYRNKTALPVQRSAVGKPLVCGYYERRTHNAVPFGECAVLRPPLEELVRLMIGAITEAGLDGYDEKRKSGCVRHLIARAGGMGPGCEVLTGIAASRDLSAREMGRLRNIFQKLLGEIPGLAGSVLNINPSPGNFIWGPVFKRLCGKKYLDLSLNGYRFETEISAFFQVNSPQAEAIFEHAGNCVGDSVARLLELYSGVGGLTAHLASRAGRIDAVEEWRPAVRQLRKNMSLNGISNVEAHQDSAENFLQSEGASGSGAYDVVVLDPPRTGCDERVIEGIKKIFPKKIVYVSCNPATLARDLSRVLSDGHYEIESLSAFDMFPQTAHVESVAVICRS